MFQDFSFNAKRKNDSVCQNNDNIQNSDNLTIFLHAHDNNKD